VLPFSVLEGLVVLGNLGSWDVGFDEYREEPAHTQKLVLPPPHHLSACKSVQIARFVLPSGGMHEGKGKSNNAFDKCGKAERLGEGCTS
jgi:hypothetical protein